MMATLKKVLKPVIILVVESQVIMGLEPLLEFVQIIVSSHSTSMVEIMVVEKQVKVLPGLLEPTE